MPSVYTAEDDISDDQQFYENLKNVPTRTIERVDPETQDRRDAKLKRQRVQYELERQVNEKLAEAQLKRQREIDNVNSAQELVRLGYDKYGGWPSGGQIFYDLKSCLFCQEQVAFVSPVNRGLRQEHSLTLPYEIKNGPDEFKNYPQLHYCIPEKIDIPSTLHFLIKRVYELEIEDKRTVQKARDFANWASMGPVVR